MVCSLQLHNCLCSEEVHVYEPTHWALYLMVYTAYILQMQFNIPTFKYLFC